MTFLTEREVGAAIKKLVRDQSDVRIAVAFWGAGAADLIGIERTAAKPRILCNLDSGVCNPDEILALSKMSKVRTHAQLHAKVYWTPVGVIVGSSNASSNGLWGEGKERRGWREANMLIRDPPTVAEIGAWFEAQWDEGRTVTDSMVEAARQLWIAGRERAPRGKPLKASLIEAYNADPSAPAWGRVKVAVSIEDLSDDAREQWDNDKREYPEFEKAYVYEGWGDQFGANQSIIDVDGIRAKPVVSYASTGNVVTKLGELTYLRRETSIDVPGIGRFVLTPSEKRAFASLVAIYHSKKSWLKEGGRLLSLKDALREIAKVS